MISTLRDELHRARTLAESGDGAGAAQAIDRALAELDDTRLVPVDEAASVLGVRSSEVLAGLLRVHDIQTVRRDDTLLIPLSEVARIDVTEWIQRLRLLDRLHDLSSDLGGDAEMTADELDALEAGRPGRPPWHTKSDLMDHEVLTYAVAMAGTDADLDPELEAAGLELVGQHW